MLAKVGFNLQPVIWLTGKPRYDYAQQLSVADYEPGGWGAARPAVDAARGGAAGVGMVSHSRNSSAVSGHL